jgi:hypothetical protein
MALVTPETPMLLLNVKLDERSSNSNISSLNRGEAKTVAVEIVSPR